MKSFKTVSDIFKDEYSLTNTSSILKPSTQTDFVSTAWSEGEKDGSNVYLGEKAHKHLRFTDGYVYCFSGYPGSGKSEFLNYLSILQAKNAGRKIAMYSPENYPVGKLVINLLRAYLGKNVSKGYMNQCTQEEYMEGLEFLDAHYYFLQFNDIPRLDIILDTYQELADDGVTMFITDPFNATAEGAHMGDSNNISKYLKVALTQMKIFAEKNKIINCIVEHPHKPGLGKNGELPEASPWTLYGGSMWWNKMDGIIILSRDLANNGSQVLTKVWKSKDHRLNGIPGNFDLEYRIAEGRYYAINEAPF